MNEKEELMAVIVELISAIEKITYPAWNGAVEIYTARYMDDDVTEELKPALDRAKKVLGL